MRFFNLGKNSNYVFLNNLPISDNNQKEFLKNFLSSTEINVNIFSKLKKNNLKPFNLNI